jgi:hypothetical protein
MAGVPLRVMVANWLVSSRLSKAQRFGLEWPR